MKDYTTRVELMAIPIVAVLFGGGLVLALASAAGIWAWLLVGLAGLVLAALLFARYARRHPHPAAEHRPRPPWPRRTVAGRHLPGARDRRRELRRPGVPGAARRPRRRPHGRGARGRSGDRLAALALDG